MTIRGPAYVAGASGHLGTAITEQLIRQQVPVFAIAYRHPEKLTPLAQLAEELDVPFARHRCDLCSAADVEASFSECAQILGHPRLLINAQGSSSISLFQDHDADELDSLYAENLRSVALTSQAAISGMLAHGGGAMLNISSMWGRQGAALEVWYSALKAGVLGLTRALARELGPSQIRVNALAPGYIKSPMNGHVSAEEAALFAEETVLGRLGESSDIVPAALYLLSEEASWVTGQVLSVDGGRVIGA